jgi:hypothetical protein
VHPGRAWAAKLAQQPKTTDELIAEIEEDLRTRS